LVISRMDRKSQSVHTNRRAKRGGMEKVCDV
jgi:hypothetical protein